MIFTVKYVITLIIFALMIVQPQAECGIVNKFDVEGYITDPNLEETVQQQSVIYQWVRGRFDIVLGFVLGIIGANIVEYFRSRRIKKQFRVATYSELKQMLADLTTYAMHPDANINEEKVLLWWESRQEFKLYEVVLPTESKGEAEEKNKILEKGIEHIGEFVLIRNSLKDTRIREHRMTPPRKLNCVFISHNIEKASTLKVQNASRLLNILRRIDALNSITERINSTFEKTFDGSISDNNKGILEHNYYSNCQLLSDFAEITAKEVAVLIRRLK